MIDKDICMNLKIFFQFLFVNGIGSHNGIMEPYEDGILSDERLRVILAIFWGG